MQTGHNLKTPIEYDVKPIKYGVLIKVEKVEDLSAGGLYIPESAQEKQQYNVDRGEIIDMSDNAFKDTGMWKEKPKIGEMVLFNKYAGTVLHKRDGREKIIYRLCNDTEILAILKEKEND